MGGASRTSSVSIKGREIVILHALASGRAHDLQPLDESELGADEIPNDDDDYHYYGDDEQQSNNDDPADAANTPIVVGAAVGGCLAVALVGAFVVHRRLRGGGLRRGGH